MVCQKFLGIFFLNSRGKACLAPTGLTRGLNPLLKRCSLFVILNHMLNSIGYCFRIKRAGYSPDDSPAMRGRLLEEFASSFHSVQIFEPWAWVQIPSQKQKNRRDKPFIFLCWRRERDSNPRYNCLHTRFPSVRIRPLCHLSVI